MPARVYSVRQNSSELKVTIADLANTGLDETSVIDYAIKTLSAGGEVTFNIPQRIDSVYGRSVGIQRGDGSRSMIGVFDYHGRLYQIEAKALAGGSDAAAETLRFHQSLVFTEAVRTVPRIRSALIVKPVPTLSAHLRASTTHAALVIPANEMARWFGEGPTRGENHPRLPSWATGEIGSYLRYIGRGASVVANSARDP